MGQGGGGGPGRIPPSLRPADRLGRARQAASVRRQGRAAATSTAQALPVPELGSGDRKAHQPLEALRAERARRPPARARVRASHDPGAAQQARRRLVRVERHARAGGGDGRGGAAGRSAACAGGKRRGASRGRAAGRERVRPRGRLGRGAGRGRGGRRPLARRGLPAGAAVGGLRPRPGRPPRARAAGGGRACRRSAEGQAHRGRAARGPRGRAGQAARHRPRRRHGLLAGGLEVLFIHQGEPP